MFAFALETRPVEDNDFFAQSMPSRLSLMHAAAGGTQKIKKMDEELFTKLRERGFSLTWELEPGGGEVGIWGFVLERVARGSSKLIASFIVSTTEDISNSRYLQ